MSEKKEQKKTRREFLKAGITAGAGAVLAGGMFSMSSCKNKEESGEKVKMLTTDGKTVEVDKAHICSHNVSPSEIRHGIPGRKFVMVIDLSKCKNARGCVEKCQEMHHLPPEQEWLKVYLMKDSKETSPYWMPKPCFHCENPPCVSLCPVGATFKRDDGIVLVDNTLCIGCKFCMTGCPYSARIFNWGDNENSDKNHPYSPELGIPQVHGTIGKCDFCPDMAREGKLPACVTGCPNGVIYYGDLNEDVVSNGTEIVRFSHLIKDKGGYQYAEELGTEPNVYYLPITNRMFPVERGIEEAPEGLREQYKKIIFDKEG